MFYEVNLGVEILYLLYLWSGKFLVLLGLIRVSEKINVQFVLIYVFSNKCIFRNVVVINIRNFIY